MGFDPSNTIAVGIGITAFFCTITCVFLFATAYRERPARMLGFVLAFYALWASFGLAFHLTNDPWLEREFRLISIFFQILGQVFSVEYAYAYLGEYRQAIRWERILYWLLVAGNTLCLGLTFADLLGTRSVAGLILPTIGHALSPEPGPLVIWFMGFFLVLGTACGAIMLRRAFHEKGDQRRAGTIMACSIVAACYMGSTSYLVWYGFAGSYTLLRIFTIPFFIVAAFYTITDYRLFNVRVATAELFIFAMWGFLTWRVLSHASISEAIPDVTILAAVIALGLLLIRNVTQELASRIKLEAASEELRVLNGSLESKVAIRTEELARSERHIEQVVEYLPVGLIEIEENGTIVRINDVAEALFGLKKDAAVGTTLLTHPILVKAIGEQVHAGSFDTHVDETPPRDLEVAIAPLSLPQGNGFIITVRDVTEKRALERAKNDFVTSAADQLRAPLSLIKKTFDVLGTEILSGTQKEVVERGASGIANMEHIAEGLTMIARTTDGMSKYAFTTTDLHPLLQSIITLVTPLAEKKHVSLAIDIAQNLPVLSIDKGRIEFAIQNLLDNAIKYTPADGTITLHVHHDDKNVTIEVSDTGIGISEADQERLFEKFFRARRATEMATDGSGLGLAIAKSIAVAHGGTISVVSEEGKGSTFTIILPVSKATA